MEKLGFFLLLAWLRFQPPSPSRPTFPFSQQVIRSYKVKIFLEVRKEPNVTYIEGYNGTLLDPDKVTYDDEDDVVPFHDAFGDANDDDGLDVIVSTAAADGADEERENRPAYLAEVQPMSSSSSSSSDSQYMVDSASSVSSSSSSAQSKNKNSTTKKRKRKKALELSLTCTTESAKPPVTHSWYKISGDKTVQLTPVNSQIIQIDEITGVTTTKSTVKLNLSPSDKVCVCV